MSPDPGTRIDRVATWAFWLYLVAAAPVLIGVFGTGYWFTWDDWELMYGRNLSWNGLFAQYHGHWCTLPFAVMLTMFHVIGMNSYRPYQMLTIGSHLICCALLFLVIRKMGVRPWVAAIVAGAFVLFGFGAANIESGFQITFVWPVMFGLGQLLLVDHDGAKLGRRDLGGLLLGFAGLMSSGVAVAVVFAVCLTVLLRRGWRASLMQAVPLGGVYIGWYVAASPSAAGLAGGSLSHSARVLVDWTVSAMQSVPNSLAGRYEVLGTSLGVALTIIIAIGVVQGLRAHGTRAFRGRFAAAWGLAAGSVVFAATCAFGRAGLPVVDTHIPRYIYVYTLMLVPLIAVAIDWLRTRALWLALPGVGLIAIGVPANIGAFRPPQRFAQGYSQIQKRAILAFASSPLAPGAPPDLIPVNVTLFGPRFGPSIGWLVAQRRAGRIPKVTSPSESLAASINLQLGIEATPGNPVNSSCSHGRGIFRVKLEPKVGDTLSFSYRPPDRQAAFTISLRYGSGQVSELRTVSAADARHLTVVAPDLRVVIGSSVPTADFQVCKS